MTKKYFVKTRNWHCKKWVKIMLDISLKWGVYRGDSYNDGDGKYCFETYSKTKAILTWLYFMLFYKFSGGWTYILDTGLHKYIANSSKDYAPASKSHTSILKFV